MRRYLVGIIVLFELSVCAGGLDTPGRRLHSKKDRDLICSACENMMRDMHWKLNRPSMDVDLQGRLDSKGERWGKKYVYKGSELSATEATEYACGQHSKYAKSHGAGRSARRFVRSEAREGEPPITTFTNIELGDPEIQKSYLRFCNEFIGDHEEVLASELRKPDISAEQLIKLVCIGAGKVCPVPANFNAPHRNEM